MRPFGWERRLHDFVESRRLTPFAWGDNDCCGFALAGVLEMWPGRVALPPVDVSRTGALAARAALRRLGCDDAADVATLLLGDPLASLRQAGRGDVVAFDGDHGATLGLCLGGIFAAPGADGLVFMPMPVAALAWKV